MILSPFQPYLPEGTTSLAVTASAQTMTRPSPSGLCSNYRLACVGTQTVYFLAFSAGSPVVAATTSTGIPLLAGTVETFTLPTNVQLSVIAGSTGSTLSVTPGEGA